MTTGRWARQEAKIMGKRVGLTPIKLGGVKYSVARFNLGQLARVEQELKKPNSEIEAMHALLRIVLERTTPAVNAASEIVPISLEEVRAAISTVLVGNGFRLPKR
jgi:hypothetical protein